MAKILIVEDDEGITRYLSALLHSRGHATVAVCSASHAHEALATGSDFDLLTLDRNLGAESGFRFLVELRRNERWRNLPVLVCSGDTKPASVKAFLPWNIAGFIKKPFRPERLLADVDAVLHRRQPLPPPTAPAPAARVAPAKILIVEDDEKTAGCLRELLVAQGHAPTIADSATQARATLDAQPGFSLLILDHHLGCESGLGLLTGLRKLDRFRHLSVLICSGDTESAAVKGFLKLNIAGFIAKPFAADRILADVERVLRRRERTAARMA